MTALQTQTSGSHEIPPHILVMEDDLNVAKGLKMVFDEEGYAVDLAATGELAIKAFKEKRFDLLVADLRLPAHHPAVSQHVSNRPAESGRGALP